ncbi:MAG: ester cyclase [Pseudomonadota bacterium]
MAIEHLRARLAPLRAVLYDFDEAAVRGALSDLLAPACVARLCHPFGTVHGADGLYEALFAPLSAAMPDVEANDFILMAGPDEEGAEWVGLGTTYVGTFAAPFLGIPPTGRPAHMRAHEFFRFDGDKVVEIHAIWDLPELMHQAGAWPLAPSLGREWRVPGPATQDGLRAGPRDGAESQRAMQVVLDMLTGLKRHPREPAEAMEMPKFWHPKMSWYGPAGIGSCRGIRGFRHIHQIPFLNAMPDRGQYLDEFTFHFFGDGPYVAVTGWPNMVQTLTDAGWLGIPPLNQRITMSSLDFWRIGPDGRIRENWVLVDLIDMYRQIGVDVFARLHEFNHMRPMGRAALPPDPAEHEG